MASRQHHPARQGEAAADKVDDQEQSLPFLQTQYIGDEEQYQGGRNRRGDAAHRQHDQQAAKVPVGEHCRQRQVPARG